VKTQLQHYDRWTQDWLKHALTSLSQQHSHGWRTLAYLQKWKACNGLHGLQGLVGVGLRLRGVRLEVKLNAVNTYLLTHTHTHTQNRSPSPPSSQLWHAQMKTATSWRVNDPCQMNLIMFEEQVPEPFVWFCSVFDIKPVDWCTLKWQKEIKSTS